MVRNINLILDFRLFFECALQQVMHRCRIVVFAATRQSVRQRLPDLLLPVFVWIFNV